jgi:nicotinamidase-related amidase
MALKITPKSSVLLLLDYQNMITMRVNASNEFIQGAKDGITKARSKGITIAHCRVAFDDQDKADIPATNFSFARFKDDPQMLAALDVDSPTSAFHKDLSPEGDDLVFRKTRVGPFMAGPSTSMHDELKKRGIDTILIGGLSTSGAVLSAVRQAADLDYRLVVLEDMCADNDEDVHKILVEKVLARQAHVVKSSQLEELI